MRITFYSNHLTHHQLPFCLQLARMEDVEFTFVANAPLPAERLALGYADMNTQYPFVLRAYEGADAVQKAQALADSSHIVIAGSDSMKYLRRRLKEGKLTFRYTERPLKTRLTGLKYWKFARAQRRLHAGHPSLYLLAASAFAPGDYKKMGLFQNRAYRWGYFPSVTNYDNIDALIDAKEPHSILWCGRLIDWKHPESAIAVARHLKAQGKDFQLYIIGCGEMEAALGAQIQAENLSDSVHMLGSMSPEEVRRHMEKAEIFLFTSDRQEGWGAVLNEAMNSGCAVVASHAIGSVPFLLQSGSNGLIYREGDTQALCAMVSDLLNGDARRKMLGRNAYAAMTEQWNGEAAARRLLALSEVLIKTGKPADLFETGPCSKAEILQENGHFTN